MSQNTPSLRIDPAIEAAAPARPAPIARSDNGVHTPSSGLWLGPLVVVAVLFWGAVVYAIVF